MQFNTLARVSTATIIEKKSEFMAHAAPVATEEEALAFLEEIKKKHRTASHAVYAYQLRLDNRQRYSDDGEPAKTAGLPILNVLMHANVFDCIVVVTRYFGGTLLGTGGLVRAYTDATKAALDNAHILTMRECVTLTLKIDYSCYEQARRIILEAGAKLEEPEFSELVALTATLPVGLEAEPAIKLTELTRGQTEIHISKAFFTPF